MSHAGSTRAVERALGLLAEVATVGSVSLSEAARRAQLPTSTALRLLRTLETSGFVVRDPAGVFAAGPRLLQIGAYAVSRQSLVRLALPGMQRIVAATGETTYLSIAGPRDTAVYIGMVEGTHPVRHTSWVGQSMPSADLAVGRALAGEVPAEGYVAERDRSAPDVTAIAAPILRSGGVAGALSLLGPTYRIDEETMRRYGRIVSQEAQAVASVLAGGPESAGVGRTHHPEEVSGT
jgi:urocanate hydratase